MLTDEQLQQRYARQLILPEVGLSGQRALARACVGIIGLGALGSNVAQLLVASGIGRLVLIDHDRIALNNLHRQPLYGMRDLGQPKATAAARRLGAINPEINISAHIHTFSASQFPPQLLAANIIIDASDNFMARFAINSFCLLQQKTMVSAALRKYSSVIGIFLPGQRVPDVGPSNRLAAARDKPALEPRHADQDDSANNFIKGSLHTSRNTSRNTSRSTSRNTSLGAAHKGLQSNVKTGEATYSACYACVNDPATAGQQQDDCSRFGLLGPVAALAASSQALEALKLILQFGKPLVSKIQIDDWANRSQYIINCSQRASCPVCAPYIANAADGVDLRSDDPDDS